MAASRIQDIYLHLKKLGFEVYFPAQKMGECLSPYVVVKDAATSKYLEFSSTITYYDIMCYVPKDQFSKLDLFVEEVEGAMKGLVPMIRPVYTKTPSFYDDSFKAHMVSIQYKNFKQILL